jgi:hypothetical protein
MRFVIFEGEHSISDLVARIFGIHGRGSQASANQAEAHLLKANPHLTDLSKVAVGSLVAVPDTAPAISPDQGAVTSRAIRSLAAQSAQSALGVMQQRLAYLENSAANRLKSAMGRIQNEEFKTALASLSEENIQLPVEMPDLDTVTQDTEAAINDLQSGQDIRKKCFTQLQTALSSFAKK